MALTHHQIRWSSLVVRGIKLEDDTEKRIRKYVEGTVEA
jgi:hypothetical protein